MNRYSCPSICIRRSASDADGLRSTRPIRRPIAAIALVLFAGLFNESLADPPAGQGSGEPLKQLSLDNWAMSK